MNNEENRIRMKPKFIRLSDGSLMNINNIVAISEADSKVFVLGYQRIPITEEDMANVLGNIKIIDDDEHQHHCGQDTGEEAHVSLNELLGMKVICVGGSAMKCEGCSLDCGNCVKVELVGGDYLCLAEPQQEKTIISFDEEEDNVMDDIKEKTEDFLNYLESIFKTEK